MLAPATALHLSSLLGWKVACLDGLILLGGIEAALRLAYPATPARIDMHGVTYLVHRPRRCAPPCGASYLPFPANRDPTVRHLALKTYPHPVRVGLATGSRALDRLLAALPAALPLPACP